MAKLNVDVLSTVEAAHAVEPEWRALADERGAGPFLVPAVALPWWEHLGKGQLLVATVRDDGGRLLGLAPLHERSIGGLRLVRWLGFGLGAVGSVLERDSALDVPAAVWEHLAGDRRRALQLVEYPVGDPSLDALRRSDSWQVQAVLRDACPFVDLRPHDSVASLLAEPGKRKLRQAMARNERIAEKAEGELRWQVLTTASEVDAVLDDLTAVHDAAEAGHPRLHFLAGAYRPFLLDALRRCAEESRLAVTVVRVDERPIAFNVVITAGPTAHCWIARIDPAAADWAAGHVMLREAVTWAIGHGFERLDLQLGDDAYKLRWSNGAYDTAGVVGAAPGHLRRVQATLAGVEGLHRLRHRLRR